MEGEEEEKEEEEEEEGQKRSMNAFVFGILDERSGTVAGAKAFAVLLGCFPTGCWRVLPRSGSQRDRVSPHVSLLFHASAVSSSGRMTVKFTVFLLGELVCEPKVTPRELRNLKARAPPWVTLSDTELAPLWRTAYFSSRPPWDGVRMRCCQ